MSRRHANAVPVPAALRKRGIVGAVEIAPAGADFRIRDAGARLGLLFRAELRDRMAARAAAKQKATA